MSAARVKTADGCVKIAMFITLRPFLRSLPGTRLIVWFLIRVAHRRWTLVEQALRAPAWRRVDSWDTLREDTRATRVYLERLLNRRGGKGMPTRARYRIEVRSAASFG